MIMVVAMIIILKGILTPSSSSSIVVCLEVIGILKQRGWYQRGRRNGGPTISFGRSGGRRYSTVWRCVSSSILKQGWWCQGPLLLFSIVRRRRLAIIITIRSVLLRTGSIELILLTEWRWAQRGQGRRHTAAVQGGWCHDSGGGAHHFHLW